MCEKHRRTKNSTAPLVFHFKRSSSIKQQPDDIHMTTGCGPVEPGHIVSIQGSCFDPAVKHEGDRLGLPKRACAYQGLSLFDFLLIVEEFIDQIHKPQCGSRDNVVDSRTFEVTKRIPLANGPHNLSASMSARKIYAAIIAEPLIQVIDMDSN